MLAGQNQTKNYTGMQQYIDEVQALLAPHRQKKKDPQKFANKVAAVVRKAYHLTRIGNEQPFMPAFSAEWVSLFHNDGNLAKKFIFNPRPVFFPDKLNDGIYSNRSKNINASILSEKKSISLPKKNLSRENKTPLSSPAAPPIGRPVESSSRPVASSSRPAAPVTVSVPISQSNLMQQYLTSLLASSPAAPPISMPVASSSRPAAYSSISAVLATKPEPKVITSDNLTQDFVNHYSNEVLKFIGLGGNLYEQEQPFDISANLLGLGHHFNNLQHFAEIYPICSSGKNRSQIFYAALHSIKGFENKVQLPHGASLGFDNFIDTENKDDNDIINWTNGTDYRNDKIFIHDKLNNTSDKFIGNIMMTIPRVRRIGFTTIFDNKNITVKEIKLAKKNFETKYFKHMIISKKLILLIILSDTAFKLIVERLLETYDNFSEEEKIVHTNPFNKIYILYNEMIDNLREDFETKQKQIDAAQNIQFFFTGKRFAITNVYNDQNL